MSLIVTAKIEYEYSKTKDIDYRRSLGQFFTPPFIARFMSQWIIGNKKDNLRILDPAAGFGVFEHSINELNNKVKNLNFDLWEIDEYISKKLRESLDYSRIPAQVIADDFLRGTWHKKYDGIIANPPYYKHHHIKNKNRIYEEFCIKSFFKFSIQTNIYCWFLIKSINLLEENGRLAFIIPSEFLNSNYGVKVKEYLLKSGVIVDLINISFKENVFDGPITTSIIILGEKKPVKNSKINFYQVESVDDLRSLEHLRANHPKKQIDIGELNPEIKWRNYFNGSGNILKKDNHLVSFSTYGRFSRGIATGANNYFTLSEDEKNRYHLSTQCLKPCIVRSSYARDIAFRESDFDMLKMQGKKVYLFDGEASNEKSCKDYIHIGKGQGIDKRYLTSKRLPWYALEKRAVSKIWAGVLGRKGLKFVWNESGCINLTCFHAFYPSVIGENYLDILFVYLNTKFAKRLFDKEKREYGDGLSKFEPNDINKALAPDFGLLNNNDVVTLKKLQKELIAGESDRIEIIRKTDALLQRVFD